MNIVYKETKDFTEQEVEELFLSVKWLSGKYPERLIKALKSSSLVVTAWDGTQLKEKYRDYLYLNIMPDEKKNIVFYEKHGFSLLEEGAAMQIRHL